MWLPFLILAVTPSQVVAEFDRLAALPLWPGFTPAKTALAISDGGKVEFFRHPKPPAGFRVTANTSTDVEGVETATMLLNAERDARTQASILIHEAFHVYQRQAHKDWAANEATLFTYPVENEEAQRLALLETEALRRAIDGGAACWAGRAKRLRVQRMGMLDEAAAAYEHGTELNEGLAQYVEKLALGDVASGLPKEGFRPEAVRLRLYGTGRAWALLADRLAPGWKGREWKALETLVEGTGEGCAFTEEEEAAAKARAKGQVAEALAERRARREAYLSQEGWTVVLRFRTPAGLNGFDPMNVQRLEGGEVLHTRMFLMRSAGGEVGIMGRSALSRPAGAHPLFSGIREVVLAGVKEEPVMDGQVKVPGLELKAEPAAVRTEGRTVVVEIQ